MAKRCTHWSDGVESHAFERALKRSGQLRLYPDLVHAVDAPAGGQGLTHVLAPSVPQWNCSPSIHIRCRMTASFRATAITATRRPLVFIRCTKGDTPQPGPGCLSSANSGSQQYSTMGFCSPQTRLIDVANFPCCSVARMSSANCADVVVPRFEGGEFDSGQYSLNPIIVIPETECTANWTSVIEGGPVEIDTVTLRQEVGEPIRARLEVPLECRSESNYVSRGRVD